MFYRTKDNEHFNIDQIAVFLPEIVNHPETGENFKAVRLTFSNGKELMLMAEDATNFANWVTSVPLTNLNKPIRGSG